MTIEGQRIQVLEILTEVARAANKCEPGDCYVIARDVLLVLREQLDLWKTESELEKAEWYVALDKWIYDTNSSNGDDCRLNKIASIKALREASVLSNVGGVVMGLREAKDLVESGNIILFSGVKKNVADSIVVTLAAYGVKARVEKRYAQE